MRHFPASISLLIFLCAASVALSSCGHKTPLSLEAFRPPQAPANLAAVQRENVITLSWTYSGPETIKDFIIEERAIGEPEKQGERQKQEMPFRMVAKVTGGSYSETAVFGRTYVFRVMAESETGVIGSPAAIEVPSLVPPPPPQGLGFSIGNAVVTLKWQAIGKWNGKDVFYDIYKSGPGAKSKTLLNASPLTQNQNTFDVAPGAAEVSVYSVTAMLGGPFVYEGKSSTVTVKPADFVPARPATPTALKTDEGIRLIWNANAESWVTGYRVYRQEGGKWKPAGFSSIPSYLDSDATSGVYRITAVGSVAESPFSGSVSVPPGK